MIKAIAFHKEYLLFFFPGENKEKSIYESNKKTRLIIFHNKRDKNPARGNNLNWKVYTT